MHYARIFYFSIFIILNFKQRFVIFKHRVFYFILLILIFQNIEKYVFKKKRKKEKETLSTFLMLKQIVDG